MKFLKFLVLLLLFSLVTTSCSSKKSSNEGTGDSAEVSDELLEEDLDGDDEIVLDEGDEDLALNSEDGATDELVESIDDELSEDLADTGGDLSMPTVATASPVSINKGGGMQTYTVKRNDTLMLIAWNLYGDYTKWREIANLNGGSSRIANGQQLKYYPPSQPFNWRPEGNPYLILQGDTLGVISNKVYGSSGKWKSIWNNNRPLIKDPNLIFAGFTLYYRPDAGGVASR